MDAQTFFYTYLDEYRFLAEFFIALLPGALLLPRKKVTTHRLICSIIAVILISHFTYPYNYGIADERVVMGIMFIRNIIVFLCVALGFFLSFDISFLTAISYTTSGYAIQHLTLNIYRVIDVLFIPTIKFEQLVLVYILVYAVCYLLLYFLFVRNFSYEMYQQMQRANVLALSLIILFTNIVLNVIFRHFHDPGNSPIIVVKALYSITCCVHVLFEQYNIFKQIELRKTMEEKEYYYRQQMKHAAITKEAIERINIKYHDLKHFIANRADNILSIKDINQIQQELQAYSTVVWSGNDDLDMLIAEKSLYAQIKEVKISYMLDGKQLAFMSTVDIFSLVGNLLDNAIEAVAELDTADRQATMTLKEVMGLVHLHCENPYREEIHMSGGLPTSNGSKDYHGFGMKSVRNVVIKYGGTLKIGTENGIFKVDITFPKSEK